MKIKQFIKDNKVTIITIFILGLIAYGIKLITYSYSIDTEFLLADREALLSSWIGISRYGLVFIKRIIDLPCINIYLANAVGFLLFFLATIVCIYNVQMITEKKGKVANILLGGLIITSPIIVLQFSFTLQCAEVSLALLLLCLSFTIINKNIINKEKKYLLVLSVIFTTFAFSCYQSFLALFITFSAFFVMLFICYKKEKGIKIILEYIAVFIVSAILYKVLDKIVMSITSTNVSAYLNNQISWGNEPVIKIIENILLSIFKILTENSDFHTFGLLLCIIIFGYIIMRDFDRKKWVLYVAIFTFLFSPFIIMICRGNVPPIRARMEFSFVLALSVYFLYLHSKDDTIRKIYTIVFAMLIVSQTFVCVKLFYTDYETFKEEKAIAGELENAITLKNIPEEKTKIFIGNLSATMKKYMYKVETVGTTFFEHDSSLSTGSNKRIRDFLKSLGYKQYEPPTPEQYEEAKKIAEDMPKYPEEGSIREEKDYVIIKINE